MKKRYFGLLFAKKYVFYKQFLIKNSYFCAMKFFKVIIIGVIIALMPVSVYAQNGDGLGFGAKAGVNLADVTNTSGTGRVGFVGGVFVDYTIKRFGFELGGYYSQQGTYNVVTQGVLDNKSNYDMDYIAIQLLAKYQIFSGFRIYAGPQTNALVNSIYSYKSMETAQWVRSKNNNINVWDWGMVAGVGYTFKFGLDLSASYSRGFTDVFKDSMKGYTSTFRVTVGWHF